MPENSEDKMKQPSYQSDSQTESQSSEAVGKQVDGIQLADSITAQTSSAPGAVISRLLQGKEKEWAAVADRKGPLQLLDLPVDILKEIVREVYASC